MIQHVLKVVKHDRTTMMIAHRLSIIQEADHIFVLNHGMIKEQETHAAFVDLKEVLLLDVCDLQLGKSTSIVLG